MQQTKQPRYSHKAKTNEAIELPTLYQRALKVSVVVQFIAAISSMGIGVYTFSLCVPDKNYFVGLLAILSTLFLALIFTSICTLCNQKSKLSAGSCFMAFVIASLMMINEVWILRCTTKDKSTALGSCTSFLRSTNLCDQEGINTTDEFYIHEDLQKGSVTSTSFALISTLITMIIISIALKSGKPVYLAKKRHKSSIVVGDSGNVGLASENKTKNLQLTQSLDSEDKWYTERTEYIHKKYLNQESDSGVTACSPSAKITESTSTASLGTAQKIPQDIKVALDEVRGSKLHKSTKPTGLDLELKSPQLSQNLELTTSPKISIIMSPISKSPKGSQKASKTPKSAKLLLKKSAIKNRKD